MADSEGRAGPDGAEQEPRLTPDRLVEILVPDPSHHEPKVTLTGFLGRGAQEGSWRLYMTTGLDEYVEFNESDVVHTEPAPGGRLPTGGTMVWLRIGAPIRVTRVSSRQVQAEFLQGALTTSFMVGSGLGALRLSLREATDDPRCTLRMNAACSLNPHIPACSGVTEFCPSVNCPPPTGAFCPTREFVC